MKVFLISETGSKPSFLPLLEEHLKKQILDIETHTEIVPFADNIPARIESIAKGADLVIVFVFYKVEDFKIRALFSKLMDLETDLKVKIIKVVEKSDAADLSGRELEAHSKALAKKWCSFVINYLFQDKEQCK